MSYSGIKSGTFVGRFPNDGAASAMLERLKRRKKEKRY